MEQPVDRFRRLVWVLTIVAVMRLWIWPIANSFWLDESLVHWTIREGFWQIFPRAFISLQSIAFCVIEWLASRATGLGEVSLRLPSLAAGIATLYIYYRIGDEFLDRGAGLYLCALYLTVETQVPNARPYALALLAEAGALLWLLRWLRSGRARDGFLWAACAVLSIHLHHVFVIALPSEAAFATWAIWRGSLAKPRQLLVCCACAATLLLPAVPQVSAIAHQARFLSYSEPPKFSALLPLIVPVYAGSAGGLLILVGSLGGDRPRWSLPGGRDTAILGALLVLVPCLAFLFSSTFTNVRLFDHRYLAPTTPGLILFWGWLLQGAKPPAISYLCLVAGLTLSVTLLGHTAVVRDYPSQDWHAAVRNIPASGTVLVYTSLVESRRLDWLRQPEHWSYMMAPVSIYRPSVAMDKAFLVPFGFEPADQTYVQGVIEGPVRAADSVTVIERWTFAGPLWMTWISQHLEASGFRRVGGSDSGHVQWQLYRHPPARAAADKIPPQQRQLADSSRFLRIAGLDAVAAVANVK